MVSAKISPRQIPLQPTQSVKQSQLSERTPSKEVLKQDEKKANGTISEANNEESEKQKQEKGEWIESDIEPKESSSKSMVVQSEDITRRNFYLTLFRLYAALPFQECMQSFAKIYNDVFIHERPSCV